MKNEKTPQYIKSKGDVALKRFNEFETFRTNLKILMAFKGVSREQLSDTLKARSLKRVQDLCEGRVPPKFDEIITLSKIFETTIDNLLYKKIEVVFN